MGANASIDVLLIIEKKNSDSPNHRTPKILIKQVQTAITPV